jgi:hypothetical protein
MSFNVGPRTISAIGGSIKRVGNYRIHTFPSELVTDGLVLNLDAGDPRSYPGSGTTWTDLSGNGNTGINTSSVTYSNTNGGVLSYTGDGGVRTSVSNSTTTSSFTNQITVSIICSSNNASGYRSPLMKSSNNSWIDGFGFYQFNENFTFFINTFNGTGSLTTPQTSFGLTHWVGTYDGNNVRLYRNGVLVATSAAFTQNISNSSAPLYIGDGGGTGYNWNGTILSTQINNRALSAAEVVQNYDALKVRYTSYTNTFTPLCGGGSGKVEVLCVAGGGGGQNYYYGGGGGAGGLLYNSAFSINSNSQVSVTVGAGGTGGSSNGGNTTFSTLNSIGGGTGATSGGSGGGASSVSGTGGAGTSGQGFSGATGSVVSGGGGGGAGGPGLQATSTNTQSGGPGLQFSISGTPQFYAGGGAGAMNANYNYFVGRGGSDVGGNAAGDFNGPTVQAINAIPNTGSGGGGGCWNNTTIGSNGSNGIVIVRYPATDYNIELLIVGGGGGGGRPYGGGGGAGGLIYYSSYPVSSGTKYTVTVGTGGLGYGDISTASDGRGSNGNNSIFGPLVAFGGGGGGAWVDDNPTSGNSGGSGGGGGAKNDSTIGASGGFGVSGQGNSGGQGRRYLNGGGGGGGGAGGAGQSSAVATTGGSGGIGLVYSIVGTSTYYAGGGAGGVGSNTGTFTAGSGGLGGGGNGGFSVNGTIQASGQNGTANTGGGGGGAGGTGQGSNAGTTGNGGNGGSGIIIIAYQGPQRGIGGTVDTTSRPGYTLHRFTTTGTDFFIP